MYSSNNKEGEQTNYGGESLLDKLSPLTVNRTTSNMVKQKSGYNIALPSKKSYIVALSGGDCSGKKVLMRAIINDSKKKNVNVVVLHQESFYRPEDTGKKMGDSGSTTSIYHPKNTDWVALEYAFQQLIAGQNIKIKKYDFLEQKLTYYILEIEPNGLIIVIGMHILTSEIIRKNSDISVFIEADDDIRLSRRVYQDTVIRKISLNESIDNYLHNIKPMFEEYTEPTKKYCDVVIPHFGGGYSANHGDILSGGFENEESKAVSLFVQSIYMALREKREKGSEISSERRIQDNYRRGSI